MTRSFRPCPECGQLVADATNVLRDTKIASDVLDYLPAAVARECELLPHDLRDQSLVMFADITRLDIDVLEKLRFILKRGIFCIHADSEVIRDAIERSYSLD